MERGRLEFNMQDMVCIKSRVFLRRHWRLVTRQVLRAISLSGGVFFVFSGTNRLFPTIENVQSKLNPALLESNRNLSVTSTGRVDKTCLLITMRRL